MFQCRGILLLNICDMREIIMVAYRYGRSWRLEPVRWVSIFECVCLSGCKRCYYSE